MEIPQVLAGLIRSELIALEEKPGYDLTPAKRIEIYDAFGPTFKPPEFRARVELLQQGILRHTLADRARAHLAILTAQHVLPVWRDTLFEAELFVERERDFLGPDWDADAVAWNRDIYAVPERHLPDHVLRMANEVLFLPSQEVDLRKVLHEASELHELFGRNLGYEENELLQQAWYAGWAAHEALQQALSVGPFNRLPIDEGTTDESLGGDGAAAAPALIAHAGIFDGPFWGGEFSPSRRREFWRWWLEEAIPEALERVEVMESEPEETVPFRATVHATIRRVGAVRVKGGLGTG